MFMATAVQGHRGTVEPLPLEEVVEILREYGVIQ
jgi:hypothetical protein